MGYNGNYTSGPAARTRELQQVDQQLRRSKDTIVLGTPLCGLSTFLTQLKTHILTAAHLEGYQCLCVDCRDLPLNSPSFVTLFIATLVQELGLPESQTDVLADDRLAERLDHLLSIDSTLRLIVIVDNLQVLVETQLSGFLEQVRVVSESRLERKSLGRVLFVLGGQSLDLQRLDPKHTSPFNVAQKVLLEDLAGSESIGLARNLLSQSQRPSSELVSRYVCWWTSGHVYFLTELCSHMVNDVLPYTAASRIDFRSVDMVVDAMCSEGGDQLLRRVSTILIGLANPARGCLRDILNGARNDLSKHSPALRELALTGLVSNSRGRIWQVRNGILDRYLRKQALLAPVLNSDNFVPRRLFINLEGYRLLFEFENDLRDFVFSKMYAKFGDKWRERLGEKALQYCQGLRDKELTGGWTSTESLPLLAFSLFPYLKGIIDENWATIFHEYFKPKTIFSGYFDALEVTRNRIAHNRPLNDKEIEQLESIADLFRNCMVEPS